MEELSRRVQGCVDETEIVPNDRRVNLKKIAGFYLVSGIVLGGLTVFCLGGDFYSPCFAKMENLSNKDYLVIENKAGEKYYLSYDKHSKLYIDNCKKIEKE